MFLLTFHSRAVGGWGKGESLVLIPASCWDCPRLLHRVCLRMSQLWKQISPLTCFYAIDTSLTSCRKNACFGNRGVLWTPVLNCPSLIRQ